MSFSISEQDRRCPAFSPCAGIRRQPMRLVPHAAHHGRSAVPRPDAPDRRHSECRDDPALRQRREPKCLLTMPYPAKPGMGPTAIVVVEKITSDTKIGMIVG